MYFYTTGDMILQTEKVRYLIYSIYRSYFKFYVRVIKQNRVYSRMRSYFISFLR